MTTCPHVVVMGVSGTGKTTVGELLAQRLGRRFIEGDALHPPANIAKMSAGHPLDDEDRRPWLEALSDLLAQSDREGRPTVLTCSALRRRYRDLLRAGLSTDAEPFFVHLHAHAEVLQARMETRKHFMPGSLLRSQFDTLEPLADDESGAMFDVTAPVEDVVAQVLATLWRSQDRPD